ncbi:hypothetical protein AAE478_004127 [Parahypoxylon ruwenzoriense]
MASNPASNTGPVSNNTGSGPNMRPQGLSTVAGFSSPARLGQERNINNDWEVVGNDNNGKDNSGTGPSVNRPARSSFGPGKNRSLNKPGGEWLPAARRMAANPADCLEIPQAPKQQQSGATTATQSQNGASKGTDRGLGRAPDYCATLRLSTASEQEIWATLHRLEGRVEGGQGQLATRVASNEERTLRAEKLHERRRQKGQAHRTETQMQIKKLQDRQEEMEKRMGEQAQSIKMIEDRIKQQVMFLGDLGKKLDGQAVQLQDYAEKLELVLEDQIEHGHTVPELKEQITEMDYDIENTKKAIAKIMNNVTCLMNAWTQHEKACELGNKKDGKKEGKEKETTKQTPKQTPQHTPQQGVQYGQPAVAHKPGWPGSPSFGGYPSGFNQNASGPGSYQY